MIYLRESKIKSDTILDIFDGDIEKDRKILEGMGLKVRYFKLEEVK